MQSHGIKGNTATNATSATVETGATVNVPLFINEGDKIKIDTHQVLTWSVLRSKYLINRKCVNLNHYHIFYFIHFLFF
jgi:hypothetical protein